MSQLKIGEAEKDARRTNRFRRISAQIVATSIKNLLSIDRGMFYALPSIVIPALTGIQNVNNRDEHLSVTPGQASWLGALGYLVQLFGSLISAALTDPLGRKLSMILVNIPFALGWYLLYQADTVWQVFVAFAMLGFAVGFMEAPIVTYLGEICEPSVRGVLIGFTHISASSGVVLVYLLNMFMAWRTIALVCFSVPVITSISLCFVPETPQWLLSKNRTAAAEKSLCWLRGWVPREAVAQEFHDLQRHSDLSKSCNDCIKSNVKCTHPLPTMVEKLSELKRKRTLKPFAIVIMCFFLTQCSSILSMKPFMVQIFKAYGSPIAPDKATLIMSLLDNLANVTFILLVRFTGKRKLYLACLSLMMICTATLTWFGFTYLPAGHISFDQAHHEAFKLENENLGYIPTICLLAWSYFIYCSVNGMPWMLLSELFPFKTRGIAAGVASTINYVFGFAGKKTYYSLETALSLPGVTLLYTCMCLFGLILMYNILPETENRTLEDIERHFADNSLSLTDRKIAITKQAKKNQRENGNVDKICTVSMATAKAGVDNRGFDMDRA